MPRSNSFPVFLGLICLVLLCFSNIGMVFSLEIAFCSSDNTGAGFSTVFNEFQSNGACFDTCKASFAYGIIQGSNCWCSDFAPASSSSTSLCNDKCPGYPVESCGSTSSNLFAYFPLLRNPSGTQSSTLPTSSSSTSTESSAKVTLQLTSFSAAIANSSTLVDSDTPTSKSSISKLSSTSSWIPTPITTLITVTGELRTVTFTPTGPPEPTSASQLSSASPFSNTGNVVGLAVGVAAFVLIVCALGVLCWRRQRKFLAQEPSFSPAHLASQSPSSDLMWAHQSTSLPSGSQSPAEKRMSAARLVDQRLDPAAIFDPANINASRTSFQTFNDGTDYSRRILSVQNT